MLNKQKHQLVMGKILLDFYKDPEIASLLGFKGGTAAYFFYSLPRFSVDLDFDLLYPEKDNQKKVFDRIVKILDKYGQVKEENIKRYTVFALLNYERGEHNIKIEINTRQYDADIAVHYSLREHLGVSMLVADKDYMLACKLSALLGRKRPAARDVYDIYFFLKEGWNIDREALDIRTNKETSEYLEACVEYIESIKDNKILSGLGELVNDEKEKDWIRGNLRKETVLLLKNYIFSLKNE
jgi:predicted nucleotidyltransferase component of viral defense system